MSSTPVERPPLAPSRPPLPRPHRPAPLPVPAPTRSRLADRRGLTAAGGVLLTAALGVGGLLVDVVVADGLGTAFAVAFVAGCALAALTVHREDLRAVVVMPPLVYVVLTVLAGLAEGTAPIGAGPSRYLLVLANEVIRGAPVLVAATGAALLLALLRGVGRR